jgi:hypothetical protein
MEGIMIEEKEKIPKFRSTARLVQWVRNKRPFERLPENREHVFFKVAIKDPVRVAAHVAEYAEFVGKLDARLEELLKPDPDMIVKYLKIISNRQNDVSRDLLQSLKGKSNLLVSWSSFTKTRLEKDLEDSLDDGSPACARWCFRYAKEVLKGRLPSHLEQVFFRDTYHASKYAFEVIRGFASCRLPDELHAYMVMKSFENPNNENIKVYMDAAESDPAKIGNTTKRVI